MFKSGINGNVGLVFDDVGTKNLSAIAIFDDSLCCRSLNVSLTSTFVVVVSTNNELLILVLFLCGSGLNVLFTTNSGVELPTNNELASTTLNRLRRGSLNCNNNHQNN